MLLSDNTFNFVNPIQIATEIDNELSRKVSKKLTLAVNSGQPFVILDISSRGGECYAAMEIMEMIESVSSRIKVVTIVKSYAASAAALIFACGTPGYRFMAPHARLLFHSVQVEMDSMNVKELTGEFEEVNNLNNSMCTIASANCKSTDILRSLIEEHGVDRYLYTSDCLKHQIADHPYIPTVTVQTEVSLNMKSNREAKRLRDELPQQVNIANSKKTRRHKKKSARHTLKVTRRRHRMIRNRVFSV